MRPSSMARWLAPALIALGACGDVLVEGHSAGAAGGQGGATSTGSTTSGNGGGGTGASSVGPGGATSSTSSTSNASTGGAGGAGSTVTSAGTGGTGGIACSDVDADGDGFSPCDGDCCDAPGPTCGDKPALMNPGAFEILGNGIDDDCDASTDDLSPPSCSSDERLTGVTGTHVLEAIELCRFTVADPPLAQKTWGVIGVEQRLADGSAPMPFQLENLQDFQTAILTHLGTGGISPRKGATMAGLSNGRMRDEAAPDYQDPKGGTSFDVPSSPPASYLAAHGGVLPASGGCNGPCPSGAGANDSVTVRATIRVPTNAVAFSYDYMFLTAEYGTGVCTPFNDFFLTLLDTGAAGIPLDRNIAFDALGNPVSVNNVFFQVCVPKGCFLCPGGAAELAGTGLQTGAAGGATTWLTTDAPVVPGETIAIEWMIFDVSDSNVDSMVLLDNFRWHAWKQVIGQGP